MSTPTSSRGLRAFVLEYLHQRPGEEVFLNDMRLAAKEAGRDWNETQIRTAMSNLMASSFGTGVNVVVRSRSWRYSPNGGSAGKLLFEEIGRARDGRVVIQDDEGNLFVATPL